MGKNFLFHFFTQIVFSNSDERLRWKHQINFEHQKGILHSKANFKSNNEQNK